MRGGAQLYCVCVCHCVCVCVCVCVRLHLPRASCKMDLSQPRDGLRGKQRETNILQ